LDVALLQTTHAIPACAEASAGRPASNSTFAPTVVGVLSELPAPVLRQANIPRRNNLLIRTFVKFVISRSEAMIQVIFKKETAGNREGEVKDVATGYARNFLLPKGFAILATKEELLKIERTKTQKVDKEEKETRQAGSLAKKVSAKTIKIEVKVGPSGNSGQAGKLFGAVTHSQIAAAISKQFGVEVDKHKISSEQLKELGTHEITVDFGKGNKAKINIELAPLK